MERSEVCGKSSSNVVEGTGDLYDRLYSYNARNPHPAPTAVGASFSLGEKE